MIKKLSSPLTIPLFGLCDSIVIEVRDNLVDALDVNFCLGKVLVPAPITREVVQGGKIVSVTEKQPAQFVGSPISGNVKFSGDEYAKWDRNPDTLADMVTAKIPELQVSRESAMPAPDVAPATVAPA